MKQRALYILLFLSALFTGWVQAQPPKPKPLSQNLLSLRSLAEKEFRASHFETSITLYKSYFSKINFTDTTAIFQVAESYRLSKQYDSAINLFNQLSMLHPKYTPALAELYATKGEYSKAIDIYKSIQATDTNQIKKIASRVLGFKGREDFQLDSLDWKVTNSQINTSGNESNPMKYKEGILFISTAVGNNKGAVDNGLPRLVYTPDSLAIVEKKLSIDSASKKKSGTKKPVRKIPIDITARNSIDNSTLRRPVRSPKSGVKDTITSIDPFLQSLIKTGPIHFSSTGDTVYYSKLVQLKRKQSKLGIFSAINQGGTWKQLEEISKGFVYSAFHPTATTDGKKIYFVADSKEGFGGPDIYFVERLGDSAWSLPVNAGENINTAGNELYPTIIGDSLYFSTNGSGGLGGQDVFVVKLGTNETPINVGYPINSSFDDYGLVFNKDRTGGYVSTNRNGSSDILAFNFKKVFYRIGGSINYISDKTVASKEQVYLVDTKTEKLIDSTLSDELGNYYFDLRPNRLYRIEQREERKTKASYVVNTKEPVYLDSTLLAKKTVADQPSIASLGKSIDSIKQAIAAIEKVSESISREGVVVDSLHKEPIVVKKQLLKSQLKELKSDLTRLEYKKLELAYSIQPTKDIVAVNTTKPVEKIKVNLQLPGASPKQKADSIFYVRQQEAIKFKLEEELLLRGDQLTRFNVYFGFSKFNLNPIEQKILDSTIKVLKANPRLYAVMGSFTDCSGPIVFNMQLSAKRSDAVIKYLIKNGIEKNRIRENHYGKNYLVQNCNQKKYSARQQLLNRRTEIYLSDDGSLAWTDLAADTTKKYSVYTALGKKLSDFISLKGVLVVASRKGQGKIQLTAKKGQGTADKGEGIREKGKIQLTVDSSQLTAKVKKQIVKKDTLILIKKVDVVRKDTAASVVKKIADVKKDTIAVVTKKVDVVKKDTIANVVKKIADVKKDTVAIVAKKVDVLKKDTVASVVKKVADVKRDTIAVVTKKVADVKKDTAASIVKKIADVKKDTVAIVAKKVDVVKKDTIASVVKKVADVKKDTIAVVAKKVDVVKKDTVASVVKKIAEIKSDTFSIVKADLKGPGTREERQGETAKPTTYNLQPTTIQTDSFVVVKPQPKQAAVQPKTENPKPKTLQQDTVAIAKAKPSTVKRQEAPVKSQQLTAEEEERISREELLAALDSLAKLRREQERIVDYLTKRISKKPIEVFTYADSVTVEIFDSGIHDKDSVSVIYNKSLVVDKHELKVDKPIKFKVRVDKERKNNEMVIVAENLGTYPPNTAVMIITDKFGKHEEIMLSTDLTTNEVVIFIRIDKQSNK